jgi:hypothetical protein
MLLHFFTSKTIEKKKGPKVQGFVVLENSPSQIRHPTHGPSEFLPFNTIANRNKLRLITTILKMNNFDFSQIFDFFCGST